MARCPVEEAPQRHPDGGQGRVELLRLVMFRDKALGLGRILPQHQPGLLCDLPHRLADGGGFLARLQHRGRILVVRRHSSTRIDQIRGSHKAESIERVRDWRLGNWGVDHRYQERAGEQAIQGADRLGWSVRLRASRDCPKVAGFTGTFARGGRETAGGPPRWSSRCAGTRVVRRPRPAPGTRSGPHTSVSPPRLSKYRRREPESSVWAPPMQPDRTEPHPDPVSPSSSPRLFCPSSRPSTHYQSHIRA